MRNLIIISILLIVLGAEGCVGYRIGSRSLHNESIRTVYVPMFESDSFRRNFAERMTEAVCKRIETRTGYKVVNRPSADSVLTGRIVSDSQSVTHENLYSDVRQKNVELSLQVVWADRRGTEIRRTEPIPLGVNASGLSTNWNMVPEMGDSTVMAQQKAIEKMADQVVDMMEEPW